MTYNVNGQQSILIKSLNRRFQYKKCAKKIYSDMQGKLNIIPPKT